MCFKKLRERLAGRRWPTLIWSAIGLGLIEFLYVFLLTTAVTAELFIGFFENIPPGLGPLFFLMVFVVSVAVSGLTVFGYPLWLVLTKRDVSGALVAVAVTLLTFFVAVMIALVIAGYFFPYSPSVFYD